MFEHLTRSAVQHAQRLFLSPDPVYQWEEIVRGVQVCFPNSHTERRDAVGVTFRGFYKIDKSLTGAKEVYDRFFLENKESILRRLQNIEDQSNLHDLSDEWRQSIVRQLGNIRPEHVKSYGKTRKPIDLYTMNLIALSAEAGILRERIVPLLLLPLDSQMFQKAFSADELRPFGLTSRSTYGDLRSEKDYTALQGVANRRARDLTKQFGTSVHPIYLEMLWRNRMSGEGQNLFTASPMRTR